MNKAIRRLGVPCLALCLALTCAPGALTRQSGDLKAEAAQYLAAHEPQLRQTTHPAQRLFPLSHVAAAAFAAGDTEKARAYARELLALGEQLKSQRGFGPSNYSQATHVGNLVLGRIALAAGDVGKAKEHLLAAVRVPGSPTLDTFGPNMLLAKELIEKGERGAAVEYFDLCAKFWAMEGGKLAQWKGVVRQGGMPDFGANLRYNLDTWRPAR